MKKRKIVILEDDASFVAQIEHHLAKAGYEVTFLGSMESVENARGVIFQNMPNLILCDIRMKPSGFEILEAIKDDTQLRLIPFIFLSAVKSLPQRVKAYLNGVDDYITKPIKEEELIAKINSIVRRQEEVEKAIYLDPLTQIHNRRFFQKELERQINLHRRHGDKFTLAMLDLDHFKAVNDTYGHQCGDQCLVAFSQFVQAQIRSTDLLARWGGEEFILVMVRSAIEGATNTVQNILDTLRSEVLVDCDGQQVTISFSAGVAQFPDHGETRTELIEAADRAVYRAKEKGRGRVELAEL